MGAMESGVALMQATLIFATFEATLHAFDREIAYLARDPLNVTRKKCVGNTSVSQFLTLSHLFEMILKSERRGNKIVRL